MWPISGCTARRLPACVDMAAGDQAGAADARRTASSRLSHSGTWFQLQIRRHRREAKEKLGPKFDQRHFHDAILAIGSVPLPMLEQRMAQFIADGGVNPPAVRRP
jgi:hypothetical protein